MSWTRFFRRRYWDEERKRELEAYLEIEADENIARGMSPGEARRAAHRKLGNTALIREEIYRINSLGWLESLWQDLRFAVRMLHKNPGFTAVAVVTLALGIGVNTAIFSLLNDTILASLPISRPQELVQLRYLHDTEIGANFNWPDFAPLLEPQPALPGLFAYLIEEMNLQCGKVSERVRTQLVSGSYYSTLRVNAYLGRTLDERDDQPGAEPVAVLSYTYWGRRFGFDPAAIGGTVYLDGTPFAVVGVAPPEFYGLNRLTPPDITCPLHVTPLQGHKSYYVYFFARLQPSVSIEHARAQVAVRFHALLDEDLKPERGWMGRLKMDVISAATGEESVHLLLREPLRVLGILVGIVLLICCTNLATLLLARAAVRSREIAVRLALGTSRRRLVRMLLIECVLLGGAGGAVGLTVGYGVHRLLRMLLGIDQSMSLQFHLHWPLLGFTAALSLITGAAFGLVPALRAAAVNPNTVIKGDAPGVGRLWLGPARAFLVGQVAASVLVLVGATLFNRTLRNLEGVDVGFNRDHLLLMTIDPRESRFQGDQNAHVLDELTERVRAVPGVRSASFAEGALFQEGVHAIWVQGAAQRVPASFNNVGPGFFATAGIPLLMGRDFSARDRIGAQRVAIINEAFARTYFPGQNPLGQRFGDDGPQSAAKYEIVGLVKDSRSRGLRWAPHPAGFQLTWQCTQPFVLHVRVMGDPRAVTATLVQAIHGIDPALVVYDVRTMTQQMNGTLHEERTFATLSAMFGALALGLCCVGL